MPQNLNYARFVRATAAAAVAAAAAPLLAAGFQLNENTGSGLGNAFAGGAAVAEDAGTLWSNAAGMSRLRSTQVAGVVHLVRPAVKFHNDGSAAALGQSLGGDGGDAGGVNVVPNLYLVMPVNAQWSAGIGLNGPWGLVTDYEEGWVGRFQAVKSSIRTINVNPAVSWKPAGRVTWGLGLNYQHIEAEFTNRVNYTATLLQAAARAGVTVNPANVAGLESRARVEGSDSGWGWNAGVLWDIDANSRAGAHYRSAIKYRIAGDATFSHPAAPLAPMPLVAAVNAQLADSAITADVELPPIANLSYFRTLDSRWDLMADVQWTGWSSIQALTFLRANGSVLQSTPENFRDAWKFSLGVNHRYDGSWTWRGGLAYDQSPVRTDFRTPRLPDADRTWLTAGAQYKASRNLTLDFGTAYIWVASAWIDSNPANSPAPTAASGRLRGNYNNNVVIVSGQATWSF